MWLVNFLKTLVGVKKKKNDFGPWMLTQSDLELYVWLKDFSVCLWPISSGRLSEESHVPWVWSCVWAGCVRVGLVVCPRGGTVWSTRYRSWTCSQRSLWWPPEPEEVYRTDTWLPCCQDSLCACTYTHGERQTSVIYCALRLIWKVNTYGLGYMYTCLFNCIIYLYVYIKYSMCLFVCVVYCGVDASQQSKDCIKQNISTSLTFTSHNFSFKGVVQLTNIHAQCLFYYTF